MLRRWDGHRPLPRSSWRATRAAALRAARRPALRQRPHPPRARAQQDPEGHRRQVAAPWPGSDVAVRAGLGLPRAADRAAGREADRPRQEGSHAEGGGAAPAAAPTREKFVDIQRAEFERLGVLGDWEDPYLTMDSATRPTRSASSARCVEAGLRLSRQEAGALVLRRPHGAGRGRGRVRRHTSPSIVRRLSRSPIRCRKPLAGLDGVRRRAASGRRRPGRCPPTSPSRSIPDLDYVAVDIGERHCWSSRRRWCRVSPRPWASPSTPRELRAHARRDLEGARCRHPWLDRDRRRRARGLRHARDRHRPRAHRARATARTTTRSASATASTSGPVDERGALHRRGAASGRACASSTPTRRSSSTCARAGALLAAESYRHSYPHCWRCKNPHHLPRHRAVVHRLDWQRRPGHAARARARRDRARALGPAWGQRPHPRHDRDPARLVHLAPARLGRAIPALLLRGVRRARTRSRGAVRPRRGASSRREGADAWFSAAAEELVPPGLRCANCGGSAFRRETDILDVWFDSGVELDARSSSSGPSCGGRPTSTSRAATSTAAGSTRRS